MKKPTVILATALSTLALAGAVGVGVASADPTPAPSASPTATSAPSAPTTQTPAPGTKKKADKTAKAKKKGDLTRRALHGEVTLGGKKAKVVDFQRGTVKAVSDTSITVVSKDDFSATYVVDAKTKVRQAKEKAAIGDVKTGDKVRVVASKDGSTLTAKRIADRTK
jgi:hypothetical protein